MTTHVTRRRSPGGRLGRAAMFGLLAFAAALCSAGEARAQWATSGSNINNTNPGNVGVGTAAPTSRLEVVGANGAANNTIAPAPDALRVTGGTGGNGNWGGSPGGAGGSLIFAGGTGGAPASGSQAAIGGKGGSINLTGGAGGPNVFSVGGGTGGDVLINGGAGVANANGNIILGNLRGNVGIGTATPTPGHRLHLAGDNTAAGGFPLVKLQNTQAGGHSYWLYSGANNSPGAFGIFDETANSYRLFADAAGNIGIGTTTPTASRLHVHSPGNTYLRIGAPLGNQSSIAFNDDANGQDIVLYRPENTRDFSIWTATASNVVRVTQAGNVGFGTTAPAARLHVAGDIRVDGNISAKYQDVAEWVPSREQLSAGTVVVVDAEGVNRVLASASAYDTGVAGVVSAQPGLILGEGGEGKVKVATTGRVKVRVDATRAPIRAGDLLVTSGAAGVAMKSEPVSVGGVSMHRPGTIIGKALESLERGTGEILVLLSLQ